MSLYFYLSCSMSLSPMSCVEFKKCPCHQVDFSGSRAIRVVTRTQSVSTSLLSMTNLLIKTYSYNQILYSSFISGGSEIAEELQ